MVVDNGEEVELWEYVNERMAQPKHELFKDYTFLITRMFDARVGSFVKNILKGGANQFGGGGCQNIAEKHANIQYKK